jgi:Lipopolysaccharide export system permease LptF/LptG
MTEPACLPGRTLLRVAEQILDPETIERVLLPAVADLQHECSDTCGGAASSACSQSRLSIRVRAYWGLWKTLAICLAGDAVRDREGHALSLGTRTLLFVGLLLVLVIAAQSPTWFLTFAREHGEWPAIKAALLLLPSTLTVVLPPAFFLAVAMFRTRGASMPALIPATTAGALACAAALFIGVMFVVPPINQSFRTFVFATLEPPNPDAPPRVLRKGLPELTWTELNAQIREPASRRQEDLARAHREQRFALIASVFVLSLLALSVASRWRSHATTFGVSLVLLILYGGCFALASQMDRGGAPSAYGVWTVNGAFAILGLRLLRSRSEWRDNGAAALAERS